MQELVLRVAKFICQKKQKTYLKGNPLKPSDRATQSHAATGAFALVAGGPKGYCYCKESRQV